MTPQQKHTLGVLILTAGAAYVVWRVQAAQGGPIVWINPLTALLPGNPSTVASDGSGGTNPVSRTFLLAGDGYKRPGNMSVLPALPAARGTAANPLAPPDELTFTAQPARPTFVGDDIRYLPNLGDPNLSLYDYLATMPPDLSWGLVDGSVT